MKKVFTKIAGLSVGLAMAIGVGVAVGGREAKVAKAVEYSAYKLDGTVVTSGTDDNKYDTESSVVQNGLTWGVDGNTTMNPWRIGGKGANGYVIKEYDRYVYSTAAVSSENINKIEFKVGTVSSSSSFTINSFCLTVSSAAKGEGTVESTDDTKTIASNSTITFNKPDGKDWSNKYFCFAVNVSCKGGKTSSSNVFFQLTSIEFFYNVEVQEPDTIEVSGEASVNVGSTIDLTAVCKKSGSAEGVNQNVVWESANEKVAKVDQNGHVTGVSNGTTTISAKGANSPSIVGSKSITVSAGKTDDVALVISPSDVPTAYGDNYITVSGVYLFVKQVMKGDGTIQIQKTNGLVENIAALPYDIEKIEISFNAEKTQGTGFAIKASTDGESYVTLESEEVRTNRLAYSAPSTGYLYFQITAPTSGTLYLDEVLVSFGNASEEKMVTLATALNGLLDAECTGDSDSSAITASKWAEVEAAYTGGDETAKSTLKAVAGLSYIEVNQFLSRYDYIVGTYEYNNFLEREVPSASAIRVESGLNADNNTIIIVISIAAISALAFTTLLVFKKKKQK